MNYSIALKRARALKDISQADLANRSDVNQTLISKIENGTRNPSKSVLSKLLDVLHLTPELFELLSTSELKHIDEAKVQELASLVITLMTEIDEKELPN